MPQTPPTRLIVFARAPVPGRVKTRLARRIGRRAAASVYRELLAATVKNLCDIAADMEIWVTPHRHVWMDGLAHGVGARIRVQPPGDLGERMERALGDALTAGRRPVLVGGDCALLPASEVAAAFAALEHGSDVVCAPADDGGYTLVGVRRRLPELFRRMPWGSARVMGETRRRARRGGIDLAELALSHDIDDATDWRRWRRFGRGRGRQYS